ncbi:MAG: hypothetical protein KBS70_03615 [Bacteroidales bacterium]|nr:hypothetical protein [Candidatus Colicola equi]
MAVPELKKTSLEEAFILEYFGPDFLPCPNNYVSLVHWLNIQAAIGNDKYSKCKNVTELAKELTLELGWAVDDFALRRAKKRIFTKKCEMGQNDLSYMNKKPYLCSRNFTTKTTGPCHNY